MSVDSTLGDPNIRKRFGVSTGDSFTTASSGDSTVYTCPANKHIRLKWTGWATPSSNSAETIIAMRFGANTAFYTWPMGMPGAFAHGVVREGAVNENLIVNNSAAQRIYVNIDVEVF